MGFAKEPDKDFPGGPRLFHGAHNENAKKGILPGRAGLIFASESIEYAQRYGPMILELEYKVARPADLDRDERARRIAIENFNESNFRNEDDGFDPIFNPETDDTWELMESPTFKEAMTEAGYDGAICEETTLDGSIVSRTHVAFHPEQVRVSKEVVRDRGRTAPEESASLHSPVSPPKIPLEPQTAKAQEPPSLD